MIMVFIWILLLLSFHKEIIVIIMTLPIMAVTRVKKHFGGVVPKGNRFVSLFDDIILYWIGQVPSHVIRLFYFKYVFGASIGRKVVIHKGCEIRNPIGLHIGDGSIIGDDAILDARAGLYIGCNVNLSSRVSVWTLQHDYRNPDFACDPEHYGPVRINDRVWVGPGVIILPAVTLGEGVVVAAGGVVTKSVDPFSVVGGVPVKKIGQRPENLRYSFDGKHRLFI